MPDCSIQQIIQDAAVDNSWCLCIFFSVDIEGATAYKVEIRAQKGDNDWCSLFEDFYKEFPACFLKEYLTRANQQLIENIGKPMPPMLWKFVGDEILFYAPLTDSGQTLEHLLAFHQAVSNYNQKLTEQGVKVQCKGTSWIAGFPVNNRIVLISKEKENSDSPFVDFIGSSIDCGFRLTKFSTSRRLVVSLDLLWMLVESAQRYKNLTCFEFVRTRIKYAGKHELKGVFSGRPYPVFWIDMYPKMPVEDKWITNTIPCENEDVITFCEEFSDGTNPNDFIKPFIYNDPSKLFCVVADGFEAQRQSLKNYKNKYPKQQAETKPLQKDAVSSQCSSEISPPESLTLSPLLLKPVECVVGEKN